MNNHILPRLYGDHQRRGGVIAVRRRVILLLVFCLTLFSVPVKADNVVDLKSLQRRFLSLGYEIGTADGILGTKTKSALLLAQTLLSDAGFEVSSTGQPDTTTAAMIMKEENSALLRTLLKGSWGSRVREAQARNPEELQRNRRYTPGTRGH